PSHLRRRPLWLGGHVRRRHRPARAVADVPAPGALRADHADGGIADRVARALPEGAARGETMSDILDRLRDIIQADVGNRGLRTDPAENLVTACPDDFRAACQSLAQGSAVAIVTGFYIPTATPPAAETDGPLGALFLARACSEYGLASTVIVTDEFCVPAIQAGLDACDLGHCPLVTLPTAEQARGMSDAEYWQHVDDRK